MNNETTGSDCSKRNRHTAKKAQHGMWHGAGVLHADNDTRTIGTLHNLGCRGSTGLGRRLDNLVQLGLQLRRGENLVGILHVSELLQGRDSLAHDVRVESKHLKETRELHW